MDYMLLALRINSHLRDTTSDLIAPKISVGNLNIVLASCKAIGLGFKRNDTF